MIFSLIFSFIFQICLNLKIKVNKIESIKHNLYFNNYLKNYEEEDDIILSGSSDITVDIYTIITAFKDKIPIPSDRYQIYEIGSGSSGTYRVISGDSVTVGKDGIIYPKNRTLYWYGNNVFFEPIPGRTPTSITTEYTLGQSKVSVNIGANTYTITVNVKDYASEYVEAKLDTYIKENVNNKKTQLEKLKAITAYPALFPYANSYNNYLAMVIFEKGNTVGSSDLIHHLCEKVGIKSHVRNAQYDVGAESLDKNVVAFIDKKYYICDLEKDNFSSNRTYYVHELPFGFSTKNDSNDLVIYQYDGYDTKINVPSKINGKTVIGIENKAFYNGPGRISTKISLPDSLTFIGDKVFYSLTYLKELTIPKNVNKIGSFIFDESNNIEKIKVDKENKEFSSYKDVLFNKNKTSLISYPPGREDNSFEWPSSLERFEDYSFYQVKYLKKLYIPKNVKFIGNRAFSKTSIKEIYFKGDPPIFGNYIFEGLNIIVYYPKGNQNWEKYLMEKFEAKVIYWKEWEVSDNNSTSIPTIVLACCFATYVIFIIIFGIYIYLKKKNFCNKRNVNSDNSINFNNSINDANQLNENIV